MNRFMKSALSLSALLLTLAAFTPQQADAQQYGRNRSDIVLVTPTGEILEYVPPAAASFMPTTIAAIVC